MQEHLISNHSTKQANKCKWMEWTLQEIHYNIDFLACLTVEHLQFSGICLKTLHWGKNPDLKINFKNYYIAYQYSSFDTVDFIKCDDPKLPHCDFWTYIISLWNCRLSTHTIYIWGFFGTFKRFSLQMVFVKWIHVLQLMPNKKAFLFLPCNESVYKYQRLLII